MASRIMKKFKNSVLLQPKEGDQPINERFSRSFIKACGTDEQKQLIKGCPNNFTTKRVK